MGGLIDVVRDDLRRAALAPEAKHVLGVGDAAFEVDSLLQAHLRGDFGRRLWAREAGPLVEGADAQRPATGDEGADARALTQAVFTLFEQQVRRDPTQWYIFRNLRPADAGATAARSA